MPRRAPDVLEGDLADELRAHRAHRPEALARIAADEAVHGADLRRVEARVGAGERDELSPVPHREGVVREQPGAQAVPPPGVGEDGVDPEGVRLPLVPDSAAPAHGVGGIPALEQQPLGAAAAAALPLATCQSGPDPRLAGSHRGQTTNGWIPVRLSGSPERIGFQHGFLLAKEIEDALAVTKLNLEHDTGRNWAFFRQAAEKILWPKLPPEYQRELRGMADGLARAGVQADVVGLEFGALVERFAARRYDSIYFGLERTTTDPAANLDFWLTSGSFHVWNPGQRTPATDWERRIDELMLRQAASADPAERRRLYAEAQAILEEHVSVLTFVAPRIYLPVSVRIGGLRVSNLRPYVLWNADLLWLRRPGETTP